MDIRLSINLLTTAVISILLLLSIIAGFTLAERTPPEPLAFCGVINTAPAGNDAFNTGKKVWNASGCGACHNKNMKDDAVGPALAGVTERWSDYPREDLYRWIRNNPKLTASGHPKAVAVSEAYPGIMNIHPGLKDEDIEGLLAYIEEGYH